MSDKYKIQDNEKRNNTDKVRTGSPQ